MMGMQKFKGEETPMALNAGFLHLMWQQILKRKYYFCRTKNNNIVVEHRPCFIFSS
jgi:hypothetical protein